MSIKQRFRKGAASFYIVAFSTLILLIVVTSFAAIIISEIERTSNADLSQSAYDSAMAGVEDAKLAYYNYQNCITSGGSANESAPGVLDCGDIVRYMEDPLAQDCDMVGRILGRIGVMEEGSEVVVQESNVSNNMQQAYTCVKVQTVLKDYRSTLSGSDQSRVVKVKFDGVSADKISKIKISWYLNGDSEYNFTNFSSGNPSKVVFPSIGTVKKAIPPTISVAMLQTAESFNLNDFDVTRGDQTDRGMVYLTPIDKPDVASKSVSDNYNGAYNGSENYIAANGFLKSNDKKATNLPYGVYCPSESDDEFVCSATIEVPKPIGGTRSDDTFMFVVSLPYGTPETDFAMEFFCNDACAVDRYLSTDDKGDVAVVEEATSRVSLRNVQVGVDSTGRANDLYRRVETRLEVGGEGSSYLSLMGPLELLGNNSGNEALLKKNYAVTTEYNFR